MEERGEVRASLKLKDEKLSEGEESNLKGNKL